MIPDRNNPNDVPESPLCMGDPLAKALAVLEPMPSGLNRDALMFAAGGTNRERDLRFWKRIVFAQAGAFCLLVVVGLSTDLFPSSTPGGSWGSSGNSGVAQTYPAPAAKTVNPKVPEPPTPSNEFHGAQSPTSDEQPDFASQLKYLRLRADVLAAGINVLPTTPTHTTTVDLGQLEDTLQMPRGTFASYGVVPKPKKTNEE
jgi:hypothetical protein